MTFKFMTNEFGKTYDDIVSYAKSQGMHIFHGVPLIGEEPRDVMLWSEDDANWKQFLEVALSEGIKTLILNKEFGQGKHINDVGSITMAWSKDGITYLFSHDEEWFEENQREDFFPEKRRMWDLRAFR